MGVAVSRNKARVVASAVKIVGGGTRWEREFDYGVIADGAPPSVLRFREWWDWHAAARKVARHTRRTNRISAAYRKQIEREGYVPPTEGVTKNG